MAQPSRQVPYHEPEPPRVPPSAPVSSGPVSGDFSLLLSKGRFRRHNFYLQLLYATSEVRAARVKQRFSINNSSLYHFDCCSTVS